MYLRTRTNIYEMVAEFDKTYIVKCRTKSKEGKKRLLSKSEVEKQANTILELCDRFVVRFNNDKNLIEVHYRMEKDQNGWLFSNLFKTPVRHLSNFKLFVYEIYGAIWIETGLKYVAKINDDGEMELL